MNDIKLETSSDMVRRLCDSKGISISKLAKLVGQSPQNFYAKIKRNTLSDNELKLIAEVLEVRYEKRFILDDEEVIELD